MTQNLLKIHSDFRSDFEDSPDFVIDFYSKHSLFLNNIRTFKDKDDLRLFIELTWQYLNAIYRKGRYNDTVDMANNTLEIIDNEINRLNTSDLKDSWYTGILFLKGMASYNLHDYKTATRLFRHLILTDSKNENYKRWFAYSTYGEKAWVINTATIIFSILILSTILFNDIFPALVEFTITAIGVLGLTALWVYSYYLKRSFRRATNKT